MGREGVLDSGVGRSAEILSEVLEERVGGLQSTLESERAARLSAMSGPLPVLIPILASKMHFFAAKNAFNILSNLPAFGGLVLGCI